MQGNGNKKSLWGREFELVQWGLDENEVVGYVNELIAKQDARSLQRIAEATAAGASDLVAQIHNDSQTAAVRLMRQAGEKAAEMAAHEGEQAGVGAQEKATAILERARDEAIGIVESAEEHAVAKVIEARDGVLLRLKKLGVELGKIGPGKAGDVPLKLPDITLPTEVSHGGNNGGNGFAEMDRASEVAFGAGESGMADRVAGLADELVALSKDTVSQGDVVDIVVTRPVHIAQLIRLRRNLTKIPNLKILGTNGSWRGPTILTVLMGEPVPLLELLGRMAEVEKAHIWQGEGVASEDFLWGLALNAKPGSRREERIVVALKADPDAEDEADQAG